MPLHGQIKRAYPRVEVLRGYNPNEPHTLSQTHPVKSDVTVASGQIVYLVWNSSTSQYEWRLGCASGSTPYVALQDWDTSQTAGLGQFGYDPDVQEAGKLTGLSCAGQFEIQSAFFEDTTYAMDDTLTYDTGGNAGDVKPAGTGDEVIGFISRTNGENSQMSLSGINSNVTNTSVITWTTNWSFDTA